MRPISVDERFQPAPPNERIIARFSQIGDNAGSVNRSNTFSVAFNAAATQHEQVVFHFLNGEVVDGRLRRCLLRRDGHRQGAGKDECSQDRNTFHAPGC